MDKARFTLFTGKDTVAKGYAVKDGTLVKVPAEPFYKGNFETLSASTEDLDSIVRSLHVGQFLTSGVHRALASGICPKNATRTIEEFQFPNGPGLMILDGDALQDFGIATLDEYVRQIASLDRTLSSAVMVCSPSASSGISFDYAEAGLRGLHCFVLVDNARLIPEVIEILHKRSVLAGWGRAQITANGSVLVKSLVDMAMRSSNQPCFEGGARLLDPRIRQRRDIVTYDGDLLCSADIKRLTEPEEAAYVEVCNQLKSSVMMEAESVREHWMDARLQDMVSKGADPEQAKKTLAQSLNGRDLFGDFVIHTDKSGLVTVAEIIANPEKYSEATCADPIDPEYGKNKAKIYTMQAKPCIHSMAHGGGGVYFLHGSKQYSRTELELMINSTISIEELTGEVARLVTLSELSEPVRHSLRKAIAKKAGVPVSLLVSEARNHSLVRATRDFNHLEAAREVINAFGEDNLIESSGYLWLWRGDGVWRRSNEREIKQKIHEIADNRALTAPVVGSVLDMVKTESHRPDHKFDADQRTINCVNGELSYRDGQWVMTSHNREHYRTSMIPIAYDSSAKAPRFLQFLDEVFSGDIDAQQKEELVLEALGYTLVPSCHLEKFFMLIGSGANGKSVLLTVLAELVGREYVSAVQPSQFENRFQRGHLQGKLANIITEIAEGAEIADAQLKALVSGEMTTAEHKHKDPFDFVPYAKHWFGTNHLPHTRDFSDALFRRAVILEFTNKFEGDKCDVHLIEKLLGELPGILNLALEGLRRLIEKKAFTSCPSNVEMARKWRLEADQVAQFVEDRCVVSPGSSSKIEELYMKYQDWAMSAGIKRTLNKNNFSGRLERLGFVRARSSGGTRLFAGLLSRNG